MLNPNYVLTDHDQRLIDSGLVDEQYIRIARMTREQLQAASTVEAVSIDTPRYRR